MERVALIRAFIFLILLIALVSCKSEEEKLRERINTYWHYRISGNLAEAYKLEYPVLKRRLSVNQYIASRSNPLVTYKSAEILGLRKEGKDLYLVKMRLKIEFIPPGGKGPVSPPPIVREEKWVKVKGQWFHVPAS